MPDPVEDDLYTRCRCERSPAGDGASNPVDVRARGRFARRARVPGATLRNAALLAVCGLALLAAQVAEATGRLDIGVSGRLLARLDVAATVIVVVAIAAAARPFVAAYLERRNRPSYAAHLRVWLGTLYASGSRSSSSTRRWSPRRRGRGKLLLTAVLFRDPRSTSGRFQGSGSASCCSSSPPQWSSSPLLGRITGELFRGRADERGCCACPACSSSLAIAVRAILVAAGSTEPFGALSWLPAHLDSFGAAIAIVTLHESGWFATRRHTVRNSRCSWPAATFAVAAFVAGLPRALLVTDGRDLQVRARALRPSSPPRWRSAVVTVRTRPAARWRCRLAVAAPGLVLAHEMSFIALARQYREQIDEGALGGLRLDGPWLPDLAVVGVRRGRHRRRTDDVRLVPLATNQLTGRWPSNPYPIALTAVVAGGFLVRVVDVADDRAAEDRRRRPALLPRHGEHDRPWPGLPGATELARLGHPDPERACTARCTPWCCRSRRDWAARRTSTTSSCRS